MISITSAGNFASLKLPSRSESGDIHETLNRKVKAFIESREECSITLTVISESNVENFFLLYPKEKVPGKALVYIKDALREWLKQKPIVPATTLAISDYTMYSIQKPKNSDFKFTPISVDQLLRTPKSNARELGILFTKNIVSLGLLGLAQSISPQKHHAEYSFRVISAAAHGEVTGNNLRDPSRLLLSNIAVFLVVDCPLFFLCMGVNELTNTSQLK